MNAPLDIPPVIASLIAKGVDVLVNYKTWVPKIKSGKSAVNLTYEASSPPSKISYQIIGTGGLSFKGSKLAIITEIAKTHKHAATVLRAAENGNPDLSNLVWYAYISGTRSYPKTGDRVVSITTDAEWLDWLETCDVSRDKVCGLELVMQNPAIAEKKRKQEEAVLIQATKITRRQDRKKKRKRSKKTHGGSTQGLTAEEIGLDDDVSEENDDTSSQSDESTGGDTDSDAIRLVADELFKLHPIKSAYHTSVPVFVDPTNPERFFYLTTGMSRIWAEAKIDCDATGSKLVTLNIPPKSSDIKWVTRSAERLKRNKGSGETSILDLGNMLTQLVGTILKPNNNEAEGMGGNAAEGTSGAVLKAPLVRYLRFCEIVDPDGSIEERLTQAGFDDYELFDALYLPREDLLKVGLRPGDITRLFKNVKRFAKVLIEEQGS